MMNFKKIIYHIFARIRYAKKPKEYSQYLKWQSFKNNYVELKEELCPVYYRLGQQLQEYDFKGKSILCLGSREASEVKYFKTRGAFSIGLDLHPLDSLFTITGDFHSLQFASESVDIVYNNALDHAFKIEAVNVEMERVLKQGGLLIVEAQIGDNDGLFENVQFDFEEDFKNHYKDSFELLDTKSKDNWLMLILKKKCKNI